MKFTSDTRNSTLENTAHGLGGVAKSMLKKAVVKRSGNATYFVQSDGEITSNGLGDSQLSFE